MPSGLQFILKGEGLKLDSNSIAFGLAGKMGVKMGKSNDASFSV